MSERTPRAQGFTLVELMIVVVIVGVLAVVAIGAYKRHTNSVRKTEVYALFGEIRTKEEAYRTEFSAYLATSAAENTLWPAVVNGNPQLWGAPAGNWPFLAINPGKPQVYCGYNVVAGPPNNWGAAAARVKAFFNNVVPPVNWWSAVAMCDNDGTAGTLYDSANAVFVTSSDRGTVFEDNVQR